MTTTAEIRCPNCGSTDLEGVAIFNDLGAQTGTRYTCVNGHVHTVRMALELPASVKGIIRREKSEESMVSTVTSLDTTHPIPPPGHMGHVGRRKKDGGWQCYTCQGKIGGHRRGGVNAAPLASSLVTHRQEEELSVMKNQENTMPLPSHTAPLVLPKSIDLSLAFVFGNAQYQVGAREEDGKGYFSGMVAGMAIAAGIILGGLGYTAEIMERGTFEHEPDDSTNHTE